MKPPVLVNRSQFPDWVVRDIIRSTGVRGTPSAAFVVRQSKAWKSANAYHYDASRGIFARTGPSSGTCPGRGAMDTIEAKVPGTFDPCVYRHSTSGTDIQMESRLDVLVYELAHEQRHLWQSQRRGREGWLCGMRELRARVRKRYLRDAREARERLSELDADLWALRKLNEWRRELFKGMEEWMAGSVGRPD